MGRRLFAGTSSGTATKAADADKLGGQAPSAYVMMSRHRSLAVKLAMGETRELAAAGGVAIDAKCDQSAGRDRIRLIARTSVANAFLDGDSDYNGGTLVSDFLQPGTPEEDRTLIYESQSTGTDPWVDNDIDEGFVMAPNGTLLTVTGEGWALGLNVAGAKCYAAGTIDVITP
ncbi:MAG: hypothetical protein LT070_06420 [Solirubrobacteraceae bacterium]|nr:hypothetical protein [Solirubrobacteraceae bacterium]